MSNSQQPSLSAVLSALMSRYQAADSAAADELVTLANPILARYFYALTGDSRKVEDLLQDCWLRIHRARAAYRPGEPVLPWMLAIARHTRVDQYRRWRRSTGREFSIESLVHHPSSDPRPSIDGRLQAAAILAVLDTIPEGQREVLLMLKVSDMSVDEVARATGSSATAVKQKAYRAYLAVRRALISPASYAKASLPRLTLRSAPTAANSSIGPPLLFPIPACTAQPSAASAPSYKPTSLPSVPFPPLPSSFPPPPCSIRSPEPAAGRPYPPWNSSS